MDTTSTTRVVLDSQRTNGRLTLLEQHVEPGAGPPLHLHVAQDESIWVLEGALLLRLGDEETIVETGASAWIPRGVAHAFQPSGGAPARLAVSFSPGGMEGFFAQLDRRAPGSVEPAALEQLAEPHGMRIVGAPLPASEAT